MYAFLENALEISPFDLNLSNTGRLIMLARQTLFSHLEALNVSKLPKKRFTNPHFGIPNLMGCPNFSLLLNKPCSPALSCLGSSADAHTSATGAKKLHIQCLSSAVHVPRIVIFLISTIVTKSLCSRLVGFSFNF